MKARRTAKRIAWGLAIALPLICAAGWIASARQPWSTYWNPVGPPATVYSFLGDERLLVVWRHERGSNRQPSASREFLGFRLGSSGWGDVGGQKGSSRSLGVEFRTLQILTIIPLAILILRRLFRRQPRPGCCLVCGYDLRATPNRCPECGASGPLSPEGRGLG